MRSRLALRAGGAHRARVLVAAQRSRHVATAFGMGRRRGNAALQARRGLCQRREGEGEHGRILDRHGGALREERQHRMGGIAEERYKTFSAAARRLAVEEGPASP